MHLLGKYGLAVPECRNNSPKLIYCRNLNTEYYKNEPWSWHLKDADNGRCKAEHSTHIASAALQLSNEIFGGKIQAKRCNGFRTIPDSSAGKNRPSQSSRLGQTLDGVTTREVHGLEDRKGTTLHDDDVSRYCWSRSFSRILQRATSI